MRACCVPGCKSSEKIPSHQFPKNANRRRDWLQSLKIQEKNQDTINKLRVCYKHFKDNDYSCCINRKRLVDTAVPSINTCVEQMEILHQETQEELQQEEIQQEKTQQKETQQEKTQQEERIENSPQQEILQLQTEENTSLLTDHELVLQHDQDIEMVKHDIEVMKQQLKIQEINNEKATKKHVQTIRRPNLMQITRKRKLSPIARHMYDSTVKLQRETRRLKKIIANLRKEQKLKTCTLSTTDHKGRRTETAVVRQRFIDMIIKNEKVAPQVNFQPSFSH